MRAKLLQVYLTLCDPMDCSPPDSSVHGDSSDKNNGVGCHFLLKGNLPDPGIEHSSLLSTALSGREAWEAPPGKPLNQLTWAQILIPEYT